jgi:hypothetical protein
MMTVVPPPTPRLQLETLFVLNGAGRIASTREPQPTPGPAFVLVRGTGACAWAVRADVADRLADDLHDLAAREPPLTSWRQPPVHERRYREMLGGRVGWGPAFAFPERLAPTGGESMIDDEAQLARHFSGWAAGEIAAGRSPVLAVSEGGVPVSICFCARRSAVAAEAGLETAAAFRGRGYGPRATAAWAIAGRQRGLTPMYSTDWDNSASLAVARKLELIPFATDWSIE